MTEDEESRRRAEADSDDLVAHARELEERAEELEREEHEVEELEQNPREWLQQQPKLHWPPLEPEESPPGEE